MMTLDEAIQHALEVAIAKEEEAYEGELQLDSTDIMSCRKCAAEHRQLAGWLTELKNMKGCIKEKCLVCEHCKNCEDEGKEQENEN